MASAVQSIDDLISVLVSMGFPLEDAQLATQFGKLSVEEAVAWIIQGKPGASEASSAPSLKLTKREHGSEGGVIGSNPFMNPQQIAIPTDCSGEAASSSQSDDGKVTSRLSMSDEQRKIRNNFEEKQREEARKKAKIEKAEQKKAKARALQEIQEDRERQKQRRQLGSRTSPQRAVRPVTTSPEKEANTPPKKSGDTTTIQVRIPNGQVFRQQFASSALLQEVWQALQAKHQILEQSVLIQPFPRKEFGEAEKRLTLGQLDLVPSAALNLKQGTGQAQSPAAAAAEECPAVASGISFPVQESTGMEECSVDLPPDVLPPHEVLPPVNVPHVSHGTPPAPSPLQGIVQGFPQNVHGWGQGHVLGQEEDMEVPAPPPVQELPLEEIAVDPHEDSDEEGEEEGAGMGQMGWGPHPGVPENWAQHPDHIWGSGQALAGHPWNQEDIPKAHHQRPAAQAAAERALQRFADASQPHESGHPEAGTSGECSILQHQVPSLVNMIVQNIIEQLGDASHPLSSMQGLPSEMAGQIINQLKKQGKLRPKVLNAFVSCRLRKLNLDSYKYTTNELLHALRLHTNLTQVCLGSCPLITDKGLEPLKVLKKLKALNLASCRQISDKSMAILSSFSSLSNLCIDNTKVTNAGVAKLVECGTREIQVLDLSRTAVTPSVFKHLQGLPNLKALSLEQTQISSLAGIERILSLERLNLFATTIHADALNCVAQLSNLQALNLADTCSEQGQGDLALQYIQGLKLHHLQLPSRHSTTDTGLRFISEMPLQVLDLTNYVHIGNLGMEFVGRIQTLKRLMLGNTAVTDEGLLLLAGLSQLQALYLDRTPVTDAASQAIADLNHLQELSLAETGISDDFLTSACLNNCTGLNKLNLARTAVSNTGLENLKLPYLTLLNVDGTLVKCDLDLEIPGCPALTHISKKNLHVTTEQHMED